MVQQVERWHTVAEVAELWQVSTSFIRRRIREGKLKAKKFGSAVRVSESEIKRYLKACEER